MSTRIAISPPCAAMVMSALVLGFSSLATAQVSIGIGLPSVSIGINVPLYPNLVPVPGYPVYYDPRQNANLFFYDGLYWVYAQDNWYTSSWYNGPWDLVEPEMVPDFVLRVPVRFYRRPPQYFYGWSREAPPRWGEHWGHGWDERRHGWDHWDRRSIPERAPLPRYQREYSRNRYPSFDEQRTLRDRNYRYQPHEEVARRHFEQGPGREHEEHRSNDGRQHTEQRQRGDERQHADQRQRADERQHSNASPPGSARQYSPAAERPPNGDRRRAPSPPGRSTADGEHGQSDRRTPDRGRPNAPSPDSHRGGNAPPAEHPAPQQRNPAPQQHNPAPPRSQPDHREPQRANPGSQQPQRRPGQDPARDSPERSRGDKQQR